MDPNLRQDEDLTLDPPAEAAAPPDPPEAAVPEDQAPADDDVTLDPPAVQETAVPVMENPDPVMAALERDDPRFFFDNPGLLRNGGVAGIGQPYFVVPRAVVMGAWNVLWSLFHQHRGAIDDMFDMTTVNHFLLDAQAIDGAWQKMDRASSFATSVPLACFLDSSAAGSRIPVDVHSAFRTPIPGTAIASGWLSNWRPEFARFWDEHEHAHALADFAHAFSALPSFNAGVWSGEKDTRVLELLRAARANPAMYQRVR